MRVVLTGYWARGRRTNSPMKSRLAAISWASKQPETHLEVGTKTGPIKEPKTHPRVGKKSRPAQFCRKLTLETDQKKPGPANHVLHAARVLQPSAELAACFVEL